ncbi:hypothetical protein GCM10023086_33420 [Streptomyces venetus]|uniref:Uncharacterized protein n=1 Tax=Streptomyces venetus TaxID=1701086 RepID=A0ABP8FWY2_9ACTN
MRRGLHEVSRPVVARGGTGTGTGDVTHEARGSGVPDLAALPERADRAADEVRCQVFAR